MKPLQKFLAEWQRKMGIKPNDDLKLRYFGFPGPGTRRKMMERKCDTCIHKKENGCEKWECEYQERTEIITCRDCEKHHTEDCPMTFEEDISWDDDGYIEYDTVFYDNAEDDGYCHMGKRREDD